MSFVTDGSRLSGCLDVAGNTPTFNGLSNHSDAFYEKIILFHHAFHTPLPWESTQLPLLGVVLLPL